jgi:hypothetical protein
VSEHGNSDPRPRDDTDAAKDIVRELADIAGQLFARGDVGFERFGASPAYVIGRIAVDL